MLQWIHNALKARQHLKTQVGAKQVAKAPNINPTCAAEIGMIIPYGHDSGLPKYVWVVHIRHIHCQSLWTVVEDLIASGTGHLNSSQNASENVHFILCGMTGLSRWCEQMLEAVDSYLAFV